MSASQEADSLEFADYLGVLRRRWLIVLVLACVGILAAGAYIVASPKAYTATATVNVTATGVSQSQGGAVAGGRTSNAVNLDTESQIVKSSTVGAIAARNLHSPLTPTALLGHVSVAVPANSSILQISCQAKSPRQAAACANAFAAAYLQNRSATAASTTNVRAEDGAESADQPGKEHHAADPPDPVPSGQLAAAGQCPVPASVGFRSAEVPGQPGRVAVRSGGGVFRRLDHQQGHAPDYREQPQEEDHPA